ncbi:MAG TPA: DUF3828 domain-containing protein [Rhizomicrobium sp.]|jgi:hypothetical protein|nr:DUF3828 domain-containing protein [Rhizomicrobium sp.]
MRLGILAVAVLAFGVSAATAAPTRIDDPVKFVKAVYATTVGKKPEPDDIYSPRLDALFKLDTKEAGGEVGRVDFDFWMNGQDGTISGVAISKVDVDNAKDRLIVVAKFKNEKTPNEIHFYFEKTAAGWKLDDVRSVANDPWVLSLMLKYGWDGKP